MDVEPALLGALPGGEEADVAQAPRGAAGESGVALATPRGPASRSDGRVDGRRHLLLAVVWLEPSIDTTSPPRRGRSAVGRRRHGGTGGCAQ
jgi:hypothetical protein